MKETKKGNNEDKICLQRWLLDVEVQDEQYISFQQWEDKLR